MMGVGDLAQALDRLVEPLRRARLSLRLFPQRGTRSLRGLVKLGEVGIGDGLGRAVLHQRPAVEPDRAIAQREHRRAVVTDEEQRSALGEIAQEAHAFLDEEGVSDRQGLVDDEDVGIDMRDHRECEPDRHAARIGLDRLIDEVAEPGELGHGRKRSSISASVSPRIEALRWTFSRPVNSGLKPAPSSSNAATRPWTVICPTVGFRCRRSSAAGSTCLRRCVR